MAVNTLVNITQDEIEYARICNLIKSQLDYQSGMEDARREGRAEGKKEGLAEGMKEGLAEGKKEGRTEGILEIARKMKNAGRPLSEITEFTGLPAETIEAMSNKEQYRRLT